jgi:integrase
VTEGIRERTPGVWEIRAGAGKDPQTGRYRSISQTHRGTEDTATKARARLVTEIDDGRTGSNATVTTLLDRWLDLITNDRSPTTIRAYRGVRDRYLVPALGKRAVRKVTTDKLDGIYTAWSRGNCSGRCTGTCAAHTKLAAGTVRHAHAMLHRAFAQAIRWGWARINPADAATVPRGHPREIEPPTPADVRALINEARGRHLTEMAVMLRLVAATGARRGELCGLRWADVDETPGALRIRRAVVVDADTGTLVEKSPKTRKGRRIAIDPATTGALDGHRAAMVARAEKGSVRYRRKRSCSPTTLTAPARGDPTGSLSPSPVSSGTQG